jgi:hypothetical protein
MAAILPIIQQPTLYLLLTIHHNFTPYDMVTDGFVDYSNLHCYCVCIVS